MTDTFIAGLIAFLVADLLLVGYVIWRRRRPRISAAQQAFFRNTWARIEAMPDRRHAVMEADKLLDAVLAAYGLSGSLGEKLKRASKLFSDVNTVWAAHKLRNQLAHEIAFHPSDGELTRALSHFRRAMTDLRAL